ncbi:MAG: phosphoribosyltransferase [Methanomicrobiaceae archaeon]|nr:phosphoribosyltransferase [Methanomicrobiaceae archaeon]
MTPGINAGSFSCELVGWEEAGNLSRILATKIRNSGYSPDIVIAIGRGGYVPARVVCDYMLHEKLTSIKIEHWGIAAEKKDTTTVVYPLSIDIGGKSVLIIDDVADTGDTLRAAVDYISSLGPSEIKTGVLHHKNCSSFMPDFYAEYVEKWRWIIYPWARHEELFGFSEKVLSGDYISPEEIRTKLSERYSLEAEIKGLTEALQDLVVCGKAEESGGYYRKKR